MKKALKSVDWQKPLRKCLSRVTLQHYEFSARKTNGSGPITKKELLSLQKSAIDEIIHGIDFCIQKKLPITKSLLSKTFDIGNPCKCLLAKATQSNYREALRSLELSTINAASFGCSPSAQHDILTSGSWSRLYNTLWKVAGVFLDKHPELGIKDEIRLARN